MPALLLATSISISMDVHFCYSTTAVVALLPLVVLLLTAHLFSRAACSSAAPYHCGWCPRHSTASLFPPDADLINGACGYGPTAMDLNGGYYIAAASAHFFRDGQGCGGCYQLRCRDRRVCGEEGVKVVVTDVAEETTNRTTGLHHFLLTKDTFTGMAKHAMSADDRFTSFDTVEVDFRRIPCEYKEKNLAVRVEETSSRSPGHLAVRFLYQGGQTDIAAVEIAQVGANAMPSWRYMTRREGAPVVWRTSRAPAGPLQLRLVVTAGSGGKWLRSDREVLPAEWQPGEVYDTGLRLTDVAVRTCSIVSRATAGEELR